MKYRYVDPSRLVIGLPARDFDSDEVDDRERHLIDEAVASGIYEEDVKVPRRRGSEDEGGAAPAASPTPKEDRDAGDTTPGT